MSLWKNDKPPVLYPDAVATPAGWVNPTTGELLVTVIGLSTFKGGASELKRVHIMGNKHIFAHGDYIVLEADFTEKVVLDSGTPEITATINGNSRTFAYFVDSSDKINPDKVTGFTIADGGADYVVGDVLTFTGGGGFSAAAEVSAVDGSGVITAITLLSGGSGYTSAPTVGVTSEDGTSASITAVLGTLTNGSGTAKLRFRYQVANNETATSGQMSFTSPIGGSPVLVDAESGAGASAAGTAVTASGVTSVTVGTPGSGYLTAPTVTFSGGGATTQATGIAVLDRKVDTITVTAGGSGYTSAPTVGFTGGAGTGATATAVLAASGSVKSVTVGGSGTGYTNGDTVLISGGGGSGATATLVTTGGNVTSVTITAGGSGYTSAPTVTVTSGSGSGNTFTAVVGKAVASVTVTAGGTGYTSAPTIGFTGGAGTGAAATAALANLDTVKSVTVTSPGAGYTGNPTITFTSDSGSSAAATATRSNVVASVTITNGGSGYWTAPTVGFSGGSGSNAAGTAVVDRGVVKSVTITNGGSGYSGVPTVSFTGVAEAPPSLAFTTSGISTGFSIDGVHPTVSSMALSGASQTNHFFTGDFITFTATCSKVVYVTGVPYITVTINGSAKQARYYQGTKSNTLIFRYEVASGDVATATQVTVTSPIVLNSGTITDYQGNSLTLTFTGPTMTAQAVN